MISDDIRSKIKRIKIYSKRLIKNGLTGDYLSAFKGSGLEFEKIREYQPGDDVRFIDWNSTARMNKLMVKQFVEERERTIILAIDLSSSLTYSSKTELKRDMAAMIAAVLAFIANDNKDKVGALFFSDKIEKWIAPSNGDLHIGTILENIFSLKSTKKSVLTNFREALNFLISLKKRNAVVFMLSDWIVDMQELIKFLKIVAFEYDFIAVRILDELERSFPEVGLLKLLDLETDNLLPLNIFGEEGTKKINILLKERLIEQQRIFEKHKIDLLDLTVDHPFINSMIKFFRGRIRRQI